MKSPRRTWPEVTALAKRVREYQRANSHYTQLELARIFGLKRHHVAYYLSAKCKVAG